MKSWAPVSGKDAARQFPHLLLFNPTGEDHVFTVPNRRFGWLWSLELTTADPNATPGSAEFDARSELTVTARSITVAKRAA